MNRYQLLIIILHMFSSVYALDGSEQDHLEVPLLVLEDIVSEQEGGAEGLQYYLGVGVDIPQCKKYSWCYSFTYGGVL